MTGRDKIKRLSEDIAELADRERQLQKIQRFPPSIPFAVSDWFVAAVNAYLAGKHATLDHALGLTRGRGKPKAKAPSGKNYERAKRVWALREFEKKSWNKVAGIVDGDVRDLQRELKRYEPDILAEFARKHDLTC